MARELNPSSPITSIRLPDRSRASMGADACGVVPSQNQDRLNRLTWHGWRCFTASVPARFPRADFLYYAVDGVSSARFAW